MIEIDGRLPDGSFRVKSEDGSVEQVSVGDLFSGQKAVLIGLPGAFTTTCHNSHVPQFVDNLDTLRSGGIDRVAILSVNDHHVMRAWAESLNAADKLDFLPDPFGTYTRALGMEIDFSAGGLGLRCKRFSALIDDGVVKTLNFEAEGANGISATGAATILKQL